MVWTIEWRSYFFFIFVKGPENRARVQSLNRCEFFTSMASTKCKSSSLRLFGEIRPCYMAIFPCLLHPSFDIKLKELYAVVF